MLFTTHSVVGAAVGAATGNPIAGFLAGAASHHVLDSIIHFDQGTFGTERSGAKYLGREAIINGAALRGFSRRDWIILFLDFSLATIIFFLIFNSLPETRWLLIVVGGLGGLMPDIIDSSPLWSKKLREKIAVIKKYHKFHAYFHWTAAKKEIWLGILTQIILLLASLYYLFH